MILKYIRYFRVPEQMPRHAKKKLGSVTSNGSKSGTNLIFSDLGKRVSSHKQKSLPERSTDISKATVATHVGREKAIPPILNDVDAKGVASGRSDLKSESKNMYEKDLIAKFSSLSFSGAPSKTQGISLAKGRRFLSSFRLSGIDDVAELIKNERCKNIIVMAGAGISTPSGIPDFRTPGTGLYENLAEYNLPDPSAIFDLHFFNYNPKPFFRLARELHPGNYQPNYVHYFIRLLYEKKILLKLFTQNIDALERAAGIPESKLVEAHGSFATATCRKCKANYNGNEILDEIMAQEVPKCKKGGCQGIIKPDIVFFGEDLPKKFFQYRKSFVKCELLIVLGTSLEVYPFASLIDEVNRSVPRVLINREVVGPFVKRKKRPNDVVIKGDIVEGVQRLVKLLGWTESIEFLMKQEGMSKETPRNGHADAKNEVAVPIKEGGMNKKLPRSGNTEVGNDTPVQKEKEESREIPKNGDTEGGNGVAFLGKDISCREKIYCGEPDSLKVS